MSTTVPNLTEKNSTASYLVEKYLLLQKLENNVEKLK